MNYSVKRGEQEFGPYTLAALQQYVAQGNISQQDLARRLGVEEVGPDADDTDAHHDAAHHER